MGLNKKQAIKIAENVIANYMQSFKNQKNFGAYKVMLHNKNKSLYDQLLWLKTYCIKKDIKLVV